MWQIEAIMGTCGLTLGFETANGNISAEFYSHLPFIAITTHTSVSAGTNRWEFSTQLILP